MMDQHECYGKLIGAALMASLLQLDDSMKRMTEDAGKMLGKHPDSDVCKAVDGIIRRYQSKYDDICKEALDDLGKLMLDDDILTVKEIPMEEEKEDIIPMKEEKEDIIPIEAIHEGFLNYWAELIQDTAKNTLPLPKHIIEGMERQGIVLIAMAGRPLNGLETCGACTVPPLHHKTLIFENCTFTLDIGPAYGVWFVRVDGIPEDRIRRFKLTLHGLETEAVMALTKDLGEYKGGA